MLLETKIKGSLLEGLLLDGVLLLAKMGREVSYGRGDAEDLMKGLLDGHGDELIAAEVSVEMTEATATVLLLLSPLL